MIIQTIRLRNFRNHDDLSCVFTAGVNAVVGANGSGKSSVIEAIMFLLFGEGYGSKAEMLKAGAVSGWVEGVVLFEDGKDARIRRELHASKVTLTYDGVDYVKAGDVKQLWDRLFQVDGNVFRNVNVASQGEIPLLFSGDEAVRRSIFQKVFMVPNTNTLRNSVWNDYLKKAPPDYLTLSDADEQQKNKRAFDLALEIESINKRKSALTMMTQAELTQAQKEIFEAQQCINARAQRATLDAAVASYTKQIATLKASIAKITKELDGAPELSLLVSLDKTSIAQKAQRDAQRATLNKRTALEAKRIDANTVSVAQDELAKDVLALGDAQAAVAMFSAEMSNHTAQKKKLSCIAGHKECPTCGNAVNDVSGIIAQIDTTNATLSKNIADGNAEIARLRKRIDGNTKLIADAKTINDQIDQLTSMILDIEAYDEAAHKDIQAAIVKLTDLTKQKTQLEHNQQLAENNRINSLDAINKLPVFNNAAFSTEEDLIQWNNTAIASHNSNVATLRQFDLDIQKNTLEIEQIGRDIAQSNANKQLNVRRKAYVDGLQRIYDVLHPSQFAAMLIRTYASTLQDKLVKYLSQFNFKYTVTVNDEFKLVVTNDDGDVLPKVSGGQAMVIGLSLRLALHDMFSQSLSLFCCDEPTQGLDTENQALLFELVENLKQSGIKQVIIIDHNTALSRVVDTCITLT